MPARRLLARACLGKLRPMTAIIRRPVSALLALFVLTALLGTEFAATTGASDRPNVLAPVAKQDGWSVGTPRTGAIDALKAAAKALEEGKYPNVHAVLMEHAGKLVYEQYLTGRDESWGRPLGEVKFDSTTQHDLRSISKSVTSLVLGIALKDAHQAALKSPLLSYFPDHAKHADPKAQAITLEHALTMTAGLEWNEMDVPYSRSHNDEIQIYYHKDPYIHALTRPMREKPGERWYYNGGLTMLLAGVVSKLTGKPFRHYAQEVLFEPLGISEFAWMGPRSWPEGTPSAASGLRLTARDLARIGSLVLHEGRWGQKQVVPADWIKLSIRRLREDLGTWGGKGIYGYGYQWWIGRFASEKGEIETITGVGHGGQRLFIVPKDRLVITVFAGNYNSRDWMVSERVMKRLVEAYR